MEREIDYVWRLREVMAARGMNNISDLLPLLADRGIQLSASQIYRLLGSKPERMNLKLLGALLDLLDCSFEDLCPMSVEAVPSRLTANARSADLRARKDPMRPRRARIHRPE